MFRAVWIEIPVNDLERAMAFYQAVFDLQPTEITDDGKRRTTTLLNGGNEGQAPGISLNQTKNFSPSDKGVYIILTVVPSPLPICQRLKQRAARYSNRKRRWAERAILLPFSIPRATRWDCIRIDSFPAWQSKGEARLALHPPLLPRRNGQITN